MVTKASLIIAALSSMEAPKEALREALKEALREATTRPKSARISTWATVIMETSVPTPTVTKISESQQAASAPKATVGSQLEPPPVDHLRLCLLPLSSSTRLPISPWKAMP